MGDSVPKENKVFVKLKDLPQFTDLSAQVKCVINESSWWDKYGVDWCILLLGFSFYPIGYYLLDSTDVLTLCGAILLLACAHSVISNKGGHLAAHSAIRGSKTWNNLWMWLSIEFLGSYPLDAAYDTHIKIHHPYTNIIGLGDSSSWKAPFLPRDIYLFVAPLFLPLLIPTVGSAQLLEMGSKVAFVKYQLSLFAGLALHLSCLMYISGFSFLGAIVCLVIYRAVFSVAYIHINIFQHIGLPMYSKESKPKRIYQMSSGCLNLSRNIVLDFVYGHSLVNCHVEHHLFPGLSDNMCLKIKPIVRKFLLENGLPYNEDTYKNRLLVFFKQYEDLMVKCPPITHFVGIP